LKFEADSLSPHDAVRLVGVVRSIVNAASAMEASVAERVAQGRAWERDGARSAEDWLAGATGTSPGEARDALGTARRRRRQPRLDDAARKGSLAELRMECERIKANADTA